MKHIHILDTHLIIPFLGSLAFSYPWHDDRMENIPHTHLIILLFLCSLACSYPCHEDCMENVPPDCGNARSEPTILRSWRIYMREANVKHKYYKPGAHTQVRAFFFRLLSEQTTT